uniref:Fibronectin type-III domain-containing protein n=1 Tax=Polytomella parva TaxID=51329 RepID=A0A7S0UTS1_9CHLO|mmetsp:Transcript_17480/g.31953  ORF Transcript_17480/g.31953 Transcript_17480/m.31953 type:complete len:566 (+) Transcript_17480:35-1732(+)|eukprot:CAMPEP_0175070158 /NCGR_PEP_ID=MMETSP0052_2-20121109/18567_1 /TAXON_ID=51329 ORGANISM="Polytomella parva, Strain SAG 63-3" /NCGR_SAMPLE_ID=MMETSP0052_2 /ASSEMBLY_ACC=CAM_ASM_000194 /LENGTH=565 /DNA_ID=CAMNT_0016337257 /DNA_START=16 /DNA_END=1713 /DNA_ORIENTATION=+
MLKQKFLKAKRWYRLQRKRYEEFRYHLLDFLAFACEFFRECAYQLCLPVTTRIFSRKPRPPIVTIKDIRAKRIRLNLKANKSSRFNVEQHEIEWKPSSDESWSSIGESDLENRTVARLQPDSSYDFRARSINRRGVSSWSAPVRASTKLDPVNGGGYAADRRYTWTQTKTEVSIEFRIPVTVTKRDISITLKTDYLSVAVSGCKLLEGRLFGTVKGFDSEGSSLWTLTSSTTKTGMNIKEKDTKGGGAINSNIPSSSSSSISSSSAAAATTSLFPGFPPPDDTPSKSLVVTLEKRVPSVAPKFDFWRWVVEGEPEIDTHQFPSQGEQNSGGGGLGDSGGGGSGGGLGGLGGLGGFGGEGSGEASGGPHILNPMDLDPLHLERLNLSHLAAQAKATKDAASVTSHRPVFSSPPPSRPSSSSSSSTSAPLQTVAGWIGKALGFGHRTPDLASGSKAGGGGGGGGNGGGDSSSSVSSSVSSSIPSSSSSPKDHPKSRSEAGTSKNRPSRTSGAMWSEDERWKRRAGEENKGAVEEEPRESEMPMGRYGKVPKVVITELDDNGEEKKEK